MSTSPDTFFTRSGSSPPGFRHLADTWREEAQRLRALEANGQAAAFEQAASELDAEIERQESELLTIAEAAYASGYSEEHLRRLVRKGELPAERGNGRKSQIRIRKRNLPVKRGEDGLGSAGQVDLLEEDARSIAKARSSS